MSNMIFNVNKVIKETADWKTTPFVKSQLATDTGSEKSVKVFYENQLPLWKLQ